MKLPVTYAVFALIATAVNIGAQDLAVRSYNGEFDVLFSIAVGTGAGLVVKYILDKRYIFRFRTRDVVHDGQTFILYTVMGLATTVIFWSFEFGFQHLFATKEMRYLGGVIGLAIGYLSKYHLDKRFVFRTTGNVLMNVVNVNQKSERNHGLLTLVTVLPFFVISYFYVSYASTAWFFQDDFGFIAEYANSIWVNQLFDFSNFGRFVSRNIYWFLGGKLFGDNSSYYFIFNFFLISACANLIYKVFEPRQGAGGALVCSLLYFSLPSVIVAYIWLSNSQHLIGHLLVVLFVFHYLQSQSERISNGSVILLLSILLVGLLSNIFVGLILSLPVYCMLTNKEARRDKNNWAVVISGAVLFLLFIFKLRPNQHGAYSTSFSLDILKINAEFYFGSVWLFMGWLIASLAGAFLTYRTGRLFESWLFIASPVFYVPFAFLIHQRYLQYAALPYLFFLLGAWSLFHVLAERKGKWLVVWGGGLMALGLMWFSMVHVRYFSNNSWGANQKQLVSQLKTFNLSDGKDVRNYCFSSMNPPKNDSGVKDWDIPAEWWFLGFGKAFSLFVDPTKTYKFTHDGDLCDITFLIDGHHLVRQVD